MTLTATNWHQILAAARRDVRIQLTYRFDLVLQLQTLLFSVATIALYAKLVPPERLGDYAGGYFEFGLIGLMMVQVIAVGMNTLVGGLSQAQSEGTLEALLTAPVRLPSLLLGSLVLPTVMAAIQIVGALGAGLLARSAIDPGGVLASLPLLVLTLTTFAAVGILAASFQILTKRGGVAALIAQATGLLGGSFFPVAVLPDWVQPLSRLTPNYYALNGLRALYLSGAGLPDVLPEIAALAGFTIILFPVSIWCLARSLRIARITGILGSY